MPTVYFTVRGRPEQLEFSQQETRESLHCAFAAAADVPAESLLKLRNSSGSIVAIDSSMPENVSEERYSLEVLATRQRHPEEVLSSGKLSNLMQKCNLVGSDIEARITSLESQVKSRQALINGDSLYQVEELRAQVKELRDRITSSEYLEWIGLKRAAPPVTPNPGPMKKLSKQHDRLDYVSFVETELSAETKSILRDFNFDNWQWQEQEMMSLLELMFKELKLTDHFHITQDKLRQWIVTVHHNYNANPFHNFRHGFCVAQMMYSLLWLNNLVGQLDMEDILSLLVAGICHDLDHPGYNNAYQVNARTELAIRYNDVSPLENHHASVAFQLLSRKDCNIFENLDTAQYKRVRASMIDLILATDMARHGDIVGNFKACAEGFDVKNPDHKKHLMRMLIKCSDISNEARPTNVAEPWCDCLLEEFFAQSDMEKLEGLPVLPFMDREKVTKSSAQIGFIGFVIIPLFEAVGKVFPSMTSVIDGIKHSHAYYKEMQETEKAEKEAKEKKESSQAAKSGENAADSQAED